MEGVHGDRGWRDRLVDWHRLPTLLGLAVLVGCATLVVAMAAILLLVVLSCSGCAWATGTPRASAANTLYRQRADTVGAA
ncbi:MAG: hypothetical protein M3401_00400 [Actinomycetota bacterium]|nr:hypothetical protein [Actinomycetota bacterium]